MSEQAVHLQPSFVLQHRPYRESSLLLELFTRDFGIVSVLAKGVRKEKSTMAGVLLPFTLLNVSFLDRHELKTLSQAEYVVSYPLQRLALYCGFYVNELLQRFLHRHDPHDPLFEAYRNCLRDLADADAIEQTLRYFELKVLEECGYGIDLEVDSRSGGNVADDCRYRFIAGLGVVEDATGLVGGETLRRLATMAPLGPQHRLEAKGLLRAMLDAHLSGRPLKSRDVLSKIIKYL